MNSFLSVEELQQLGLQSFGKNVLISRKASIYGPNNIRIGNHVRVDDFCVLSGNIVLNDYIHVSTQAGLFAGRSTIEIGDFTAISSRTMIYAENDDYSGESMVNPMVPDRCRNVEIGRVQIGRHNIIGSGSVVLPGVSTGEGVAVGAMSLIKSDLEPWAIYAGVPATKIRERSKKLLEFEKHVER